MYSLRAMDKILVSACLLGRPVRYDGRAKTLHHGLLKSWQEEGRVVPLCPEVAAGFATPRAPAEIEAGRSGPDILTGNARVLEDGGDDVTAGFRRGAEIALQTARNNGCRFALLTDGSPSCGSTFIYSGAFDGTARTGQGVVAALLSNDGIAVFAEDQIDALAAALATATEGR